MRVLRIVEVHTRRIACTSGSLTQEAVSACSSPNRLTRLQRSDSAYKGLTYSEFRAHYVGLSVGYFEGVSRRRGNIRAVFRPPRIYAYC